MIAAYSSTVRIRRPGFTLVELLVVVGIMLVLISISVMFANSGVITNQRISSGANTVSGWLLQARAKAFRDRTPCGVRFLPDANGIVTQAQFIEVPEPLVPNRTGSEAKPRIALHYWRVGSGAVTKEAFILFTVPSDGQSLIESVSRGDVLALPFFKTLHLIDGAVLTPMTIQVVEGGAPVTKTALKISFASPARLPDLPPEQIEVVSSDPGTAGQRRLPYISAGFAIHRQAQPMMGEQNLLLSTGTAIQVSLPKPILPKPAVPPFFLPDTFESTTSMSVIPTVDNGGSITGDVQQYTYDVMFSPKGELMNTGSRGKVVLWLRNPELIASSFPTRTTTTTRAQYDAAGEMVLITVYSKTGAVATHPVALPPANTTPYAYTKDGIASGL